MDRHASHTKFCGLTSFTFGDMNYCLVIFGPGTDGRKATHKSMGTGALQPDFLVRKSMLQFGAWWP